MKLVRIMMGLLCSSFICTQASSDEVVINRFTIRAQDRDKTIQAVNSRDNIYLPDVCGWNMTFDVTPEFTQSFRARDIARSLFGPAVVPGCNTIAVQGSAIADRAPNALFGENFYLPPDFNGILTFEPKIQNILINLDLYLGFDEYIEGLYLRLYGPIVSSRWKLNFCESYAETVLGYPAGYFTQGPIDNSMLLHSFSEYARGDAPNATTGDLSAATPAITSTSGPNYFQGLAAARILNCQSTRNGFAALRGEFGWNFLLCDEYHVGINIQGAAPTGNHVDPCNLFSAQIGNDFWEIGFGATGHYRLYENCDASVYLDFSVDINITHLFKNKQTRTFDLVGKPLSRYMLATNFGTPIVDNLQGGGITPTVQFQNIYAPIANLTTQDVHIGISVQADIVAWFTAQWNNWVWDIGYDFWARSCEKVQGICDCPGIFDTNNWALKGDARMFGFTQTGGLGTDNQAIALSATEINATIFAGTNSSTDLSSPNTNIDGPQLATGAMASFPLTVDAVAGSSQINTSIDSILLKTSDIDFNIGTRGISHKIFTAFSYNWDGDCWFPYVGIGGFVEFGKIEKEHVLRNICSDTCVHCALSQWSIFLKCGISYQ